MDQTPSSPRIRRTRALRLVLLGTGVAMVAACERQPPRAQDQTMRVACEQARAANAPNWREICERASTGYSTIASRSYFGIPWIMGRTGYTSGRSTTTGGSWFSGRGSDSGSVSTAPSSRGGFGSTASSGSRSSSS
jgi:hypothetical protein